MNIEELLLEKERVFDRISNNVQVIRKYRDKYKLSAQILEDKLSIIQELALQQIRIIEEQIKTIKEKENGK